MTLTQRLILLIQAIAGDIAALESRPTYIPVLLRNGTTINVSVTHNRLPVLLRDGTTVNISAY